VAPQLSDSDADVVFLQYALCAVTGSYQRSRNNLEKAYIQPLLPVGSKIAGRNVAFDRQVVRRWSQILTERQPRPSMRLVLVSTSGRCFFACARTSMVCR